MTPPPNPAKALVATVLAIGLLLGATFALAVKFTGGTSPPYERLDGPAIYRRLCSQCHGPDGRAVGRAGASYRGKREFWNEDSLDRYLQDPRAYSATTSRLTGRMPQVDPKMPPDARKRLVEHVLSVMDGLEQ